MNNKYLLHININVGWNIFYINIKRGMGDEYL
jgi:hypothetical protein